MLIYKPETIKAIKKLYSERKDTLEYLEKFGNRFEKAQALLIKEIAAMSNDQNTHESLETSTGISAVHHLI
jgi:hypothetical protein